MRDIVHIGIIISFIRDLCHSLKYMITRVSKIINKRE